MIKQNNRSIDSNDFQQLEQAYSVMVKLFTRHAETEKHVHQRHQLLFASSGLMQLHTAKNIILVPNNSAVIIPAGMTHSVKMLSDVTMSTLYIDVIKSTQLYEGLKIITVSQLMRELITALGSEDINYLPCSRADKIAQLIEVELALAQNNALVIPLPKDARLKNICSSLIITPSDHKTLNDWGYECGASERTLSRLFIKDLGMSYRNWKKLVTFNCAIELLADNKSIKHVASACGYKSPSAFTSAFKSHVGVLPSTLNK